MRLRRDPVTVAFSELLGSASMGRLRFFGGLVVTSESLDSALVSESLDSPSSESLDPEAAWEAPDPLGPESSCSSESLDPEAASDPLGPEFSCATGPEVLASSPFSAMRCEDSLSIRVWRLPVATRLL